MGLGLLGGGVEDALFFIKHGAKLTITDLREEVELRPSIEKINKTLKTSGVPVKWVLGKHRTKDFIDADMILKNPGVPNNSKYLEIARKNNIPIYSSAEILFEIADTNKLIGVTGTKGKSSTTGVIYEILKIKDPNAYIAGMPGVSLLKYADKATRNWGVVELSSWQLENINSSKKSPHIAIITNIEEDHLNRHGSMEKYTEAKKNIFKFQTTSDFLILPKTLKNIGKDTPSQVIISSPADVENKYSQITHRENISMALKVSKILGIDKKQALEKIKNFKGLPGRLELIAKIQNIKIYNDTTATNPFATLRSVENFKGEKVALISGGEDKDLDYKKFGTKIKNLHFVVLLPGTASDKIESEISKQKIPMSPSATEIPAKGLGTWNKNFQKVENLEKALKACMDSNPEIVLFSPAAASFNMFKNEFERGEKFVQEVKKYAKKKK